MQLTRRQFLSLVGAVAAVSGLPEGAVAKALSRGGHPRARAAARLTTIAETIRPGAERDLGYRRLATGAGEPRIVRDDVAKPHPGREGRRRTLVNLVHLTDQHIIDVQSPTRVEFLDRYNDGHCADMPFNSAHRAHEAASARITDAMLRRIRDIGYSPVTGAPLQASISTGDNTDNQQLNELMLFIGLMDGGRVHPNSGDRKIYEGVQNAGDLNYWHPGDDVADLYKTQFGFPSAPGFLEDALASFNAVGAGMPWYSCYGNHDGLAQGNAPVNPVFNQIGVGGTKVVGLPPGANPCSEFAGPAASGPSHPTTPDPDRRYISRREWIQAHLDSKGLPRGHGFKPANLESPTLYYTTDVGNVRWIVLDTVNPGGYASGSIGDAQLNWLRERLTEAQDQHRLVMLFSHHGPRSLDNPMQHPDPLDPDSTDLPRHNAEAVLDVVNAFTCVIAWVNGHTHSNVITARGTWWDIGTAAHIDWPPQSRLVEVVDNRDGTLSIFGTMVDHETDPIVAFARELCGNDPQKGFGYGDGEAADRNVELVLTHPFAKGGAHNDHMPSLTVPATGVPANLTLGGALAVVGAAKLFERRERNLS